MSESLRALEGRQVNVSQNSSESGSGILLLHGVTRNWRTFYPLLDELNNECQLTGIDFRGHGYSERTPGSYLVTDYTEDALAVLKACRSPRQFIYGHSLGAMVALATAARVDQPVDGIILEDPPFSTMGCRLSGSELHSFFIGLRECLHQRSSVESLFEKFSNIPLHDKDNETPVFVKDIRDEKSRWFAAESLLLLDPEVLDPIISGQWLTGYEIDKLVGQINCPVVLLQADENIGGMLPDAEANLLEEKLGCGFKRLKFPGVGHSIHTEKPNEVLQLIRQEVSQ